MRGVALSLLALLAASCGEREEPEEALRPVMTHIVTSPRSERTVVLSGVSKPDLEVDLSFRVAGKIERLPIKVGDVLRPGQLMASLEQEDFVLGVRQSEGTLERARAELRNADASYKRIRLLWETESASRNELDEARAAFEAAEAAVEEATAAMELSRQQLSYSTLYAGRHVECNVVDVIAEQGENVAVGEKIAELSCGSRLKVDIGVPESVITQVSPGDEVSVSFNSVEGVFVAVVEEVGSAALEATTFPVTAVIEGEHSELRPGMAVKVAFYLRHAYEGQIIIPFEGVGEDQEGHFVYLLERDGEGTGVARRRKVRVGGIFNEGIAIIEGLAPGETIIVAGVRYLHDGRRVRTEAP